MSKISKNSEQIIKQFNSKWLYFFFYSTAFGLVFFIFSILSSLLLKFNLAFMIGSLIILIIGIFMTRNEVSLSQKNDSDNNERVKIFVKGKYGVDLQGEPTVYSEGSQRLTDKHLSVLENGKKIRVYLELSDDETDVILHRV